MIKFIIMVNKQGQTRLGQYFFDIPMKERITLEGELVRKCLSRASNRCCFLDHQDFKIIYRRYASLYFIMGVDQSEDVALLDLEPSDVLRLHPHHRRDLRQVLRERGRPGLI